MDRTSIPLLLCHNNLTMGKLDHLQIHVGTLSSIEHLGPTYGNGETQLSAKIVL